MIGRLFRFIWGAFTLWNLPERAGFLGYVIIRATFGIWIAKIGCSELSAGSDTWSQLGSDARFLGFADDTPLWVFKSLGFTAALIQCLGGACFVTGFLTRFWALSLCMTEAVIYGAVAQSGGDTTLAMFLVTIFGGFVFLGGGTVSLDSAMGIDTPKRRPVNPQVQVPWSYVRR